MDVRARLAATAVIWSAFAITASTAISRVWDQAPSTLSQIGLLVLTLIIALAATASTYAVWHTRHQDNARATELARRAEKRRLARLAAAEDQPATLEDAEADSRHAYHEHQL